MKSKTECFSKIILTISKKCHLSRICLPYQQQSKFTSNLVQVYLSFFFFFQPNNFSRLKYSSLEKLKKRLRSSKLYFLPFRHHENLVVLELPFCLRDFRKTLICIYFTDAYLEHENESPIIVLIKGSCIKCSLMS